MRLDQLRARTPRRRSDDEHRLQAACIQWFRIRYPRMRHNLFAVPNGGRRDAATASRLKAEGVLAGVADLILLKPNRYYGALLIEMKTPAGRQQASQRQWQDLITADGYKYIVVRTIEEFIQQVKLYLNDEN